MTRTSQHSEFAAAVEAAAASDRELLVDEAIPMRRPARVADVDHLTVWSRNGNRTPIPVDAALRDKVWIHLGTKSSDGTENLRIDSLSFLPPAGCTRSAWALRVSKAARCQFHDLDVGGNSRYTPNLGGGCVWLDTFDKVEFAACQLYGRYTGVLVHGNADRSWGADVVIDTTTKIQNHRQPNMSDAAAGAVGVHVGGGCGGIYLGGNIIFCGVGVLLDTSMAAGASNREVFLQPGLIVDSCVEDGVRALARSYSTLEWTGAWSSSHGRGGDGCGVRIQPDQHANAVAHFTGGKVYNNPNGDGLAVNGGILLVSGLLAENNGGYGLHVANGAVRGAADPLFAGVTPNGLGPVRNVSADFKVGRVW